MDPEDDDQLDEGSDGEQAHHEQLYAMSMQYREPIRRLAGSHEREDSDAYIASAGPNPRVALLPKEAALGGRSILS